MPLAERIGDDVVQGGIVDAIVTRTREEIFSGQLIRGQRLIEADLTRRLGVGRSSVREALRRLSAEGLVQITPNRGAEVRRFSRKEMADRYQVRGQIEPLAAELAARFIDDGDNRAVFLAATRILPSEEALGPIKGHRLANIRFHRAIARLSGNNQLAGVIEQMWLPASNVEARDALGLTAWRDSQQEHGTIVDAILRRDTAEAAAAMREHLRRGCVRILSGPDDTFG